MRTGIPAMPNAAIRLQASGRSAGDSALRVPNSSLVRTPQSAFRIVKCYRGTSIKELCALGVTTAATGRWSAVATSNFCGPQFHGMWRDVEWHRGLTARIHAADAPVV